MTRSRPTNPRRRRPRALPALSTLVASLALRTSATAGFARNAVPVHDCSVAHAPAPASDASAPQLDHGLLRRLHVAKCDRYIDRSGDDTLTLDRTGDRGDTDHALSTAVAAQLFRRRPDGSMALQWTIQDRMRRDEAGVGFYKPR